MGTINIVALCNNLYHVTKAISFMQEAYWWTG